MKNWKSLLIFALVVLSFASCNKDEFTDSIFSDTSTSGTAYTADFEKYLLNNYLKPFNIQFKYQLEDQSTDMDYNLVPVSFDKAQIVAHAIKYLWLNVYSKPSCFSKDNVKLLQNNAPRILNILGSPAINAAQGTETLGVAEGGVKITLYNMNDIDLKNIPWLNQYIFHVMHHEFSHILHQNKSFPKTYEQISAGLYDSQSWQYRSNTEAYALGFVTPYSMSEAHEDFVEVISSYITDSIGQWNARGFYSTMNNDVIDSCDASKTGASIINQKLTMAKTWLADKYSIRLDSVRVEVQRRQNAIKGMKNASTAQIIQFMDNYDK